MSLLSSYIYFFCFTTFFWSDQDPDPQHCRKSHDTLRNLKDKKSLVNWIVSPDFLFTAQILVVLYICIHKLSFGLVLVPTWKKHKFANNAVTGISENVRKNNAVISENVRKNNAVISENVRKNNAVISEMKTQFRAYRYRYCMLLTFWKPRFLYYNLLQII